MPGTTSRPTAPTWSLRRPGRPATQRCHSAAPGRKIPAKRWPAERFAALARALTDQGHRVLLTGSADERALAARVADAAGLTPDAVLAGRTDLGALAALVADARLVVSGDTGVAHLATGYGTPSVVLFGPGPPAALGTTTGPTTAPGALWGLARRIGPAGTG